MGLLFAPTFMLDLMVDQRALVLSLSNPQMMLVTQFNNSTVTTGKDANLKFARIVLLTRVGLALEVVEDLAEAVEASVEALVLAEVSVVLVEASVVASEVGEVVSEVVLEELQAVSIQMPLQLLLTPSPILQPLAQIVVR